LTLQDEIDFLQSQVNKFEAQIKDVQNQSRRLTGKSIKDKFARSQFVARQKEGTRQAISLIQSDLDRFSLVLNSKIQERDSLELLNLDIAQKQISDLIQTGNGPGLTNTQKAIIAGVALVVLS